MINYTNVILQYSCPASCPEGIYLDRSYRFVKKESPTAPLFITDGNYTVEMNEFMYTMLFTPKQCTWSEISFTETLETLETPLPTKK